MSMLSRDTTLAVRLLKAVFAARVTEIPEAKTVRQQRLDALFQALRPRFHRSPTRPVSGTP